MRPAPPVTPRGLALVIGTRRKRRTVTIVRSKIRERIFFAALTVAAVAFLLMVTGTRFVMNSWSRGKIETVMTESFTRPVHLGKTSWSLGLNGVVLNTDAIKIEEKDGSSTFLTAGPTEIGLALIPMARGEFFARHIRLTDPHVNAVKLTRTRWNFSDLPNVPALKYISWMEISGGNVTIVDDANPKALWSGCEIRNITLTVKKPEHNSVWPFAIAADLPGEGYTTKVNLTGIGTGAVDEWMKNMHTFELDIANLNSEDIRMFTDAAPAMRGFVDLKLKGQGVPEKGFHANSEITTKALRLPVPHVGDWTIIDGTSSADVVIDQNRIEWRNFSLSGPDVLVRSRGQVSEWNTKSPTYHTDFDFVASDVYSLTKIMPARILPRNVLSERAARRLASNVELTVAEALAPVRLGGPGIVKAIIDGTGKDLNARFSVRGDRLSFRTVIPNGAAVHATGHFDTEINLVTRHETKTDEITGTAHIANATLSIDSGKPVAQQIAATIGLKHGILNLSDVTGRFGRGNFRLAGTMEDRTNGSVDLHYSGDNIDILQVKRVLKVLGIHSLLANDRNIAGTLASAELDIKGTTLAPIVGMHAVPKDVYFRTGALERALRIRSGSITYKGGTYEFEQVGGMLGRGSFTLNGTSTGSRSDLTISGKNLDLSDVDLAVRGLDIRPVSLQPQILFGTVSDVNIKVAGPTNNPDIQVSATPSHLYYVPKGFARTFVLTGGTVSLKNEQASFSNLRGALGRGNFVLNGTAKLSQPSTANLTFAGSNLDLSNVKLALEALGVKHPLLAQQLLFGTADNIKLSLQGTTQTPQIVVSLTPKNIYFERLGSSRTLRISGGNVSYRNDVLLLEKVRVQTERSHLITSLRLENLGKGSQLKMLEIDTPGFDFGDLHSYLTGKRTPPAVRDNYLKLGAQFGLSVPHGKMAGVFRMNQEEGHREVRGQLTLTDFGVNFYQYPIHHVNGRVTATGQDLLLEDVRGLIGKSPLKLTGRITNAASAEASWQADLRLLVDVKDFLALIATADSTMKDIITASRPIPINMEVAGDFQGTTANFKSRIAPETIVSLGGPFGGITKPAGQQVTLEGKLAFGFDDKPSIRISESKVAIGDTVIGWTGEYAIAANERPRVHFSFEIPDPIPLTKLTSMLPPDNRLKDVFKGASGTAEGQLEFEGPASGPAMRGYIDVVNASLPQLKLSHVTGRLRAKDWFPPKKPTEAEKDVLPPTLSDLQMTFSQVNVADLVFRNIKGTVGAEDTATGSKLNLRELTADLFNGKATAHGFVVLDEKRQFNLYTKISSVDVNQLMAAMFNAPREVSGKVDARVNLEGRAVGGEEFLRNLRAIGSFTARDGTVSRLKELQSKLTQGNLLKQGIIGFDVNNLLAAVAPVKSGAYETFEGKFRIGNEHMRLAKIAFNGTELRLRAEGDVDLKQRMIDLKVAGNIPRVSSSFLPKPLSKVATALSPSTWLSTLFARTPFDFPLLGSTGNNRPRSFEFTIAASLDKPNAIATAITESFRFLPLQPNATAHPPIGISMSGADERLFEPAHTAPEPQPTPAPPAEESGIAESYPEQQETAPSASATLQASPAGVEAGSEL